MQVFVHTTVIETWGVLGGTSSNLSIVDVLLFIGLAWCGILFLYICGEGCWFYIDLVRDATFVC